MLPVCPTCGVFPGADFDLSDGPFDDPPYCTRECREAAPLVSVCIVARDVPTPLLIHVSLSTPYDPDRFNVENLTGYGQLLNTNLRPEAVGPLVSGLTHAALSTLPALCPKPEPRSGAPLANHTVTVSSGPDGYLVQLAGPSKPRIWEYETEGAAYIHACALAECGATLRDLL